MKNMINILRCARVLASTALSLLLSLPAAALADHSHCICGASGSAAHCATVHTQTPINWTEWTATDSLPPTAGNYYLANDVTLSATYQPVNGVNLCLNGHVVKQTAADKSVIKVASGSVAVTDCAENLHYYVVGSDYQWSWDETATTGTIAYDTLVARPEPGTVIALAGGAITGGKAPIGTWNDAYGGGVLITSGAFTLYRGNIVGNNATGPYVSGANCKAFGSGVGVDSGAGGSGGKFTMNGGRVTGNLVTGVHSLNGGAVAGNCAMNGGDIAFNTSATGFGGGVYTKTFTPEGATFANAQPFTMTGGSIRYNWSKREGGGAYVGNVTTIGGAASIYGNIANGTTNNLHLVDGNTIAVSTTTPFATGAQIGVTTETAPVAGTPVAVTSNRGEDRGYFTSDAGYDVLNVGGVVKLAVPPVAQVISVDGAMTNQFATVADAVTAANAATTDCEIKFLTSCANSGSLIINNANGKVITLNTGNAGTNLTLTATASSQMLIDVRTPLNLKGNGGRITADLNNFQSCYVLWAEGSSVVVKIYDGFELMTINGMNDVRVVSICKQAKGYIYGGKFLVPKNGESGINQKLSTIVCWEGYLYIYGGEFHWDVSGTATSDKYWAGVLDSASAKEFKIYGGYFDGPLWWSGSESDKKYIFYGGKYTTNMLKKNASAKAGTQIWDSYLGEGRSANNISETYNGTTYLYEITYDRDPVAKNLDTGVDYFTVQEAFNEAFGGETVKLLRDITENVSITVTMSNTFDLAGNVLKGAAGSSVVSVVGDLTVIDSVGTGAITTGGASGNAYAGGIYTSGNLTLLGGAVTNCVGTSRAGGVYVSAGTFTVGGTAKVYGNFVNGQPNNVYLLNGKKMAVSATTPLADGARIGVWTVTKPRDGSPVPLTTNRGEDYGYFFSDEEFNVANDGGVVKLMDIPHPVVYDAAGGAFSDRLPETTVVTWHSGCYVLPTATPTRVGYSFLGWYAGVTNNAPVVTASTTFMSLKALKVFAKWESTQTDPGTPVVTGDDTPDGLAVQNVKPTVAYEDGNVVIPDRTSNDANSKAIVSIANYAFTPAQYEEVVAGATPIKSVVIPTFVTEIGKYAFWGNDELKTVVFSPAYDYKTGARTAVSVKAYAFAETAITNLVFPIGGTYRLGSMAFAHNPMLKDVWIYGKVTIESLDKVPFREVGEGLGEGEKVNFHISPSQALDKDFIFALTNGVNAAHVIADVDTRGSGAVLGEVPFPIVECEFSDPTELIFKIPADAPWQTPTTNNVYILFARNLEDLTVGKGQKLKPYEVTPLAEERMYKAMIPKPAADSGFLRVFVGD